MKIGQLITKIVKFYDIHPLAGLVNWMDAQNISDVNGLIFLGKTLVNTSYIKLVRLHHS